MVIEGFQLSHTIKELAVYPDAPTPLKHQYAWYWLLTGVPNMRVADRLFAIANEEVKQWLVDTFGLGSRQGPWWMSDANAGHLEFRVGFINRADAMLFKLRFS